MRKALAVLAVAGLTSAATAQISIVNNIPGAFIDISGTGTLIAGMGDDTGAQLTNTISNALFPVNGWVQSNGSMGSALFTSFSNTSLPNAAFHGGTGLAPFWDDLNVSVGPGAMYWQETAGRLIVQWQGVGFFGGTATETNTFQVQVFPSGPVLAQYIYGGTMTTARQQGNSATIGAQLNASTAATWSLNLATLQPGMVLSVIPAPGTVALLGMGGLLAARRRRA